MLDLKANVVWLQRQVELSQQQLHLGHLQHEELQAQLAAEQSAHGSALASVCTLRGFVAFWRAQCRQQEGQLHEAADAAAAAKRAAAADTAALHSEVADGEQRLQAVHQLERQLRQKQAVLEVQRTLC